MPVATFAQYREMLKSAADGGYAFPSINVTSIESANAVLLGLSEAKSDGIIQVSLGGGAHASGTAVKDSALGAISIANHVHLAAERYPILTALHTDHCISERLPEFVMPLIEETRRRRRRGEKNLFGGHMFDGSALPLRENIETAKALFKLCAENEMILEVEVGAVGGEEDGAPGCEESERLYTTPEEMMHFYEALAGDSGGLFLLAATFGNVHGVYKPGSVRLRPEILRDGQTMLRKEKGEDNRYYYVFHGGSGSSQQEIREASSYGVVKMNIDTDTQYAFTRAVADYLFKHYDGVLKVDGEVGVKKQYDPRAYLKTAEAAMAARVAEACTSCGSAGRSLYRQK